MSANNQTLIKQHKGKFYVFENVMSESWCDDDGGHVNELNIKEAKAVCDTRDEAFEKALEIDIEDSTEYGVQFNRLIKDDSEVIIVE